MEKISNSSFDFSEDLSWSCFSHTSSPERSTSSNTNGQWDDGETDCHRREYDGEENRESNYDYEENLGRSYVSYPSVPIRSPPTSANRQWDDGQDHKYGKQVNRGLHREFNKSRPYFIKNRRNPCNESNNREERQPQQIRQSLQQKAAKLQPSSQQQTRPVYFEYGFNQADLTCVDRNRRPFSNEAERQQQQMGQSLQQETFQSQPTSRQETPINSTLGFKQEDCLYIDAYTQARPSPYINSNKQALPDTNRLTFSNRYANAKEYARPNRQEGQQQQAQQLFLRGKSQTDRTPPQQTMPVLPVFGFNSADHPFIRRPPPMMPPYNCSPAPWGMNPMNLPFNLAATALPGASTLPGTSTLLGTSNLPVASSLPTFLHRTEDEHGYTCRLQKEQREARHKQKLEEDALRKQKMEEEARRKQKMEEEACRVPTPPPVVHYSDKEASILVEKLHGRDTFQEALNIFITWLERGECKKKNVSNFYSMIQSTNSRVGILMNEKQQCEDEFNKAKMMLKQKVQDILLEFNEIDKLYTAARLQKVWDHFTKAQRKNMEMWEKHMGEVKNVYLEEMLEERVENEMNISDDDEDDDAANQQEENKKSGQKNLQEELLRFKEECDSLECQLITSQNELVQLRSEMDKQCDIAQSQTQALRHALQGLWQENVSLNEKLLKNEKELRKQKAMLPNKGREHWSFDHNTKQKTLFGFLTSSSVRLITENEARLIGLISTFLNAYPLGTSIDSICTYLHQMDGTIKIKDVENFMKRFTLAFKEFIDDSLEKKWTFLGFQ